jgi:L-ascorbate metabolism protein UlaG (beta-lactamase superfamily)
MNNGFGNLIRIQSERFTSIFFRFLLCLLLILAITACAASNRRVIVNPELDQWDGKRWRYVNLFPPKYGYLEETEYDKIEFRKPHEIDQREYALLTDPRGDIDRSKGYDAAEYTVTPDIDFLHHPVNDIQITWIRHATFLIQLGGKYQILVDPVLEPVDGLAGSMMKYVDTMGIFADPPLKTSDIPFADESETADVRNVNRVAISHDHYDHLNFNTLNQLPANTRYYVPRGLQIEFPSRYSGVTGMDWYTQDTLGELKIHFLPANHRSGRSLNEMNQSLWGGWLFEWKEQRVYFAGDTGYSEVFKDIRRRYGEMDICLMPISAYFQRHWHFTPEDAIQASADLGCKTSIPWGWGTWVMSFEHILEPPRRLQYAFDKMQPENMELRILKMGETFKQNCDGMTASDRETK